MSRQRTKNGAVKAKYGKNKGDRFELKKTGTCKKVAYDLATANRVAGQRETLTGIKINVTICRDGCTGQFIVYHLTKGKAKLWFRKSKPKPTPQLSKTKKKSKSGDRTGQQRRWKRRQRLPFEVWEDEGGSIYPPTDVE